MDFKGLGRNTFLRMELFIETLTGTAFELRVSPFETIMSVKAKIQRLEGWSLFTSCILMNHANINQNRFTQVCCLSGTAMNVNKFLKVVTKTL